MRPSRPSPDNYDNYPAIPAHFSLTPALTEIPREHHCYNLGPNKSSFQEIRAEVRKLYQSNGLRRPPHFGLYWIGKKEDNEKATAELIMVLVVELLKNEMHLWYLIDSPIRALLREKGLADPHAICHRFYQFHSDADVRPAVLPSAAATSPNVSRNETRASGASSSRSASNDTASTTATAGSNTPPSSRATLMPLPRTIDPPQSVIDRHRARAGEERTWLANWTARRLQAARPPLPLSNFPTQSLTPPSFSRFPPPPPSEPPPRTVSPPLRQLPSIAALNTNFDWAMSNWERTSTPPPPVLRPLPPLRTTTTTTTTTPSATTSAATSATTPATTPATTSATTSTASQNPAIDLHRINEVLRPLGWQVLGNELRTL